LLDLHLQPINVLVSNEPSGRYYPAGDLILGWAYLVLTSRGKPFRVWVNDGHGILTDSGFIAAGNRTPFSPMLADLDGDGDLDLLIAGFADGPVEIWWNQRR